ncbi:hypothetical protein BCR34DRAFT_580438 [Clohesyomyces aquaticus]|uniref:Uncharacterized protein n=1 Tax=Clohesyomyces aquaticus TaxID=1231657 RepID=A0A1Y1Y740_9PLEO|nr:hypothetical protein BCR34DRAFT_580438 [Clohesyomyces aquaticus]
MWIFFPARRMRRQLPSSVLNRGATEEANVEDPPDQSAGQNARNAGMGAVGALGGAAKGLFDTTGNTVGALGEGLTGTVAGVGKSLSSAAMYGGSALGGAGKCVGRGIGLGVKDNSKGMKSKGKWSIARTRERRDWKGEREKWRE